MIADARKIIIEEHFLKVQECRILFQRLSEPLFNGSGDFTPELIDAFINLYSAISSARDILNEIALSEPDAHFSVYKP